jgi:transcription elongation GreA/GreB family factor
MSRAFVREPDGDDVPDVRPERPISTLRNLVTPRGLRLMDARIAELEQAADVARAARDDAALAGVQRELRYWRKRRATAERIDPGHALEQAGIGTRVTVHVAGETERTFAIVGEDEADPSAGLVCWASPVAQALLGRGIGDEVSLPPNRTGEIVAITRHDD